MRLTSDQVKDLILHADIGVRELAVEYFTLPRSAHPEIMRTLMRAVEQYGEQTLEFYQTPLINLVQDEQSVAWMIEQRRRLDRPVASDEMAPSYDLFGAIESAWFHIDGRLLIPHANDIAELLAPDDAARFNERLELWRLPAEELWDGLQAECKRLDEAHDDTWNSERASWLTHALTAHPKFAAEKVESLLIEVETGNLGDLEMFVVRLAGDLKLETAADRLASILQVATEEDADFLVGETESAMRHIGCEVLLEPLIERVEQSTSYFRNSAASILSAVHCDRTVPLALQWLQQSAPEDAWFFTKMALDQFDTEAIEPVCEWLRTTPRDPEWNAVRQHVLSMCRALAFSIPEQEAWTEDARRDREFNRQWYQEHAPGLSQFRELAESYVEEQEESFEPWDEDPLPPPIDTIVRNSPVVGRNDPCPCGSGKKFKKCCLHSRH